MRLIGIGMGLYPGDLGFQQGDAVIKLIARKPVKAFAGKQASRTILIARANSAIGPTCLNGACQSGAVIVLHCSAASTGMGLLSTASVSRDYA